MPCDLSVNAVLNFPASREGAEFRMMVIQKVLADNRELQGFARQPGQTRIHRPISRYELRRQIINVAHSRVPLDFVGYIRGGAEQELVVGRRSEGRGQAKRADLGRPRMIKYNESNSI